MRRPRCVWCAWRECGGERVREGVEWGECRCLPLGSRDKRSSRAFREGALCGPVKWLLAVDHLTFGRLKYIHISLHCWHWTLLGEDSGLLDVQWRYRCRFGPLSMMSLIILNGYTSDVATNLCLRVCLYA